ncbi:hypothetical protein IFVP182_C1190008 [Vibrio parahaemolyticus]
MERQCSRADFQQANQRLKQKTQTVQGTKARFSQTQKLEIEIRKLNQKHTDLSPKHYALGTFFSLVTNALLRCEQRNTEATADHLKH